MSVAIYAIATAPADQLKYFTGAINNLLLPRFSTYSSEEIRRNILSKCLLMFFGMLCIVAMYIICAPFLFKHLFPRYTESLLYSQLFSLALLNAGAVPAGIFFQAHGKVREQYIISVSTFIVQFIAMAIGVIFYGIMGLIIGRIVTRYTNGILTLILFYKTTKHTR